MQYFYVQPSHAMGPMYSLVTPGALPVMPSAMPKRMRDADDTGVSVDAEFASFRDLYDATHDTSTAKQMRKLQTQLADKRAQVEQMMQSLQVLMDEMQETVNSTLGAMPDGTVTESDSEGDTTESDTEDDAGKPHASVDNRLKMYEEIAAQLTWKSGYREKRRHKIQRTMMDYASHIASHHKELPAGESSLFNIACKLANTTIEQRRAKELQAPCQILIVYDTLADLERDLEDNLPGFDKAGAPGDSRFQVTMALEPLPVTGEYQQAWMEKGVDNFARFDAESPAGHRLVCTHQGVLDNVGSDVSMAFKVSRENMDFAQNVELYLQNFYDVVLIDRRHRTRKVKKPRKEIDTVAKLKHYVDVDVVREPETHEMTTAAKPETPAAETGGTSTQEASRELLDELARLSNLDGDPETPQGQGVTEVTMMAIDDDEAQVQLSLTGGNGSMQCTVSPSGQSEALQHVVFRRLKSMTFGIDLIFITETGKRFDSTIGQAEEENIHGFLARFGTLESNGGGYTDWRPHSA